jgi:regulator of sigma E protease
MITYWLLFALLFGVVVFIHELGHFLLAKWSHVVVERFAIGFGPTLVKKRWKETEYAICAFPLGGYVKMRGEDAGEEGVLADPRAFYGTSLRKRIAIAAMGPVANLFLPVLLFSALFMVGLPALVSRVGWVMPGSPAERAGLRAGDTVESIEGRSIWRWSDMEEAIRRKAGSSLALGVDRGGRKLTLSVTPEKEKSPNLFGEEVEMGRIGISPQPLRPAVGVPDPESPAGRAGLRTGDVILAVNGRAVTHWWELEESFAKASRPRTLEIERFLGPVEEGKTERRTVSPAAPGPSLARAGIHPAELFLRDIAPDSVAEKIGIRPGDQLLAVNGAPLSSWTQFQEIIQKNAGDRLRLDVQRAGKPVSFKFVPEEVEDKNQVTREKERRRQLGVVSAAVPGEVAQKKERYLNPFRALVHGTAMTGEMVGLTVAGLYKLLTGKLSVKRSLGGPISIFYLAGGSYETGGWVSFFRMMALLSITLGIINLFPIPVLDGGHLLFFLIEAVRGRPVNMRVRELAQQAGLIIIIGLMLLTFYVDIERYFFDRIQALFR